MSRHAFGYRFGHPFRTAGVAESAEVPGKYDIAIGGEGFIVDWAHYTFGTLAPFRTARDFDASPGEHSLNPENSWKRSRDDWRHGGGQFYADGAVADDDRFSSSKGVDWTTDRELTLLHDTELALVSAATNLRTLYVGGVLYVLDGTSLRYTASPHAATITWTTITLASAGLDLTTDGNKVYVATASNGLYSLPINSSTTTHFANAAATDAATMLAYCNGWLVAGIANVLTGIAADGTHQQPFTHPVTGGRWVSAVGTPSNIYAAFAANDLGAIYRLGVDNTGALTVPILATPMPAGETILSLGFYATRLLIGTQNGVRLGEIDGDGSVSLGPLIATGAQVRCFGSVEALSFFGWGVYDGHSSGLGAMRLADLVAANQPAWSSWSMTGDSTTVQAAVTSLTVVGSDAWFTVAGSGLWRPTASYVKQGTLDQGRFTFGVHEPKAWSTLEVVTAPLAGSVGAQLVNDDGTTFDFGVLTNAGSTSLGVLLSAVGEYGEQAAVVFTLYRDVSDATLAPVIRRVTFRALPNPIVADKWVYPVILDPLVIKERGGGQQIPVDVPAKVAFLKRLNRSLRPVTLQEGFERRTVQVRGIDVLEGEARGMTDKRDAVRGTYMVTLVSADGQ